MRALCTWLLRNSMLVAAAALVAGTSAQAHQRAPEHTTAIANIAYTLPAQRVQAPVPEDQRDRVSLYVEPSTVSVQVVFRSEYGEYGIVVCKSSNLMGPRWQIFDGVGPRDCRIAGAVVRLSFGPNSENGR